jgi:hypothetical protein
VLAYKVISDYRPATPNGFVALEQRAASAVDAPAPPSAPVPEATSAPPVRAIDGACAGLKEETREIEGAMNRPNTDPEISYMRQRLKELKQQISQRRCEH